MQADNEVRCRVSPRRGDFPSPLALTRSTYGASDRVETRARDPTPTLDWAGAVPYRDRKGRLAVHSRQNIRLSSDVTNPLSKSWKLAGGWGRMLDLDLMPVSRLGKLAPTSICCGI